MSFRNRVNICWENQLQIENTLDAVVINQYDYGI